jgi:hypothetical protein
MFDPLRRLKFLPWINLLQVALLTTLVVLGSEWILAELGRLLVPVYKVLIVLFVPPFGILVQLAIAVGIGALSVVILERRFRQIRITVAVLWALVPCLVLWLALRQLLPIPPWAGTVDFAWVVAVILGVFWKGRTYR